MKKFKRYEENNKIQLEYLMLSMSLLDDILENCSNEDVGEIVRALHSYERSCGEILPNIKGNGKWYKMSLINMIEEKREDLNYRSERYRENAKKKNKGSNQDQEPDLPPR